MNFKRLLDTRSIYKTNVFLSIHTSKKQLENETYKTIPLEPVSGAAGGTCPVLGAAGSSGDLSLSSQRLPGSFPAAAKLNFFTIFSKGGSCSGASRA